MTAPDTIADRLTKEEADELIADIERHVEDGLLTAKEGNRKILEVIKRIAK